MAVQRLLVKSSLLTWPQTHCSYFMFAFSSWRISLISYLRFSAFLFGFRSVSYFRIGSGLFKIRPNAAKSFIRKYIFSTGNRTDGFIKGFTLLVLWAEGFLEPGNARMAEQLDGYQVRPDENKMRCTGNRFIFALLRVKVKVKLLRKVIQNYSGEASKPPPHDNIFALLIIRSPDCLTLVFTIMGQVLSCSLHSSTHSVS